MGRRGATDYELIISWSEADRSFVAEVPELPGCMADGASYEEAVANARQIIDEWLVTPEWGQVLLFALPNSGVGPGLAFCAP